MPKSVLAGLLVTLLVGAAAARTSAHHPFAESYLENRQVTVSGVVAQWHYREPHSFMYIVVNGADGTGERWIVEAPGAALWRRSGVDMSTIRPGDRVVIVGSPGRIAAERRVRLKRISRPKDGWHWPVPGVV